MCTSKVHSSGWGELTGISDSRPCCKRDRLTATPGAQSPRKTNSHLQRNRVGSSDCVHVFIVKNQQNTWRKSIGERLFCPVVLTLSLCNPIQSLITVKLFLQSFRDTLDVKINSSFPNETCCSLVICPATPPLTFLRKIFVASGHVVSHE